MRVDPDTFRGIFHFADFAKPWSRWYEPTLQAFYLHYARIVGLPVDYWDEATLNEFLTDPKAKIPGTKMMLPGGGLPNDTDRANIIAYLSQFGADGKKK